MGQIDFNKVWQNFLSTVTGDYMNFGGRVGRERFWAFIAVAVLVIIVGEILGAVITPLVGAIVGLAILLPTGGMIARRIQDTGNNGQLAWIWVAAMGLRYLITLYVGFELMSSNPFDALYALASIYRLFWIINLAAGAASIVMIYFCAQPGQAGDNQYGPPPAPWTPNA